MNQPNHFVEDEVNLRDYWRVLVLHRFLILGIVFIAAVTAAVWTLLQPNIYQSKAIIMPLGRPSGGLRAALGEVGGLLPLGFGEKGTPAERLLAILQSRTLAENVIHRLDLVPLLFAEQWNAAMKRWQTGESPTLQNGVRVLRGMVTITLDKRRGTIIIAVEHTDPVLAASIANQYLNALQMALNEKAFSLAKKNRVFIKAQVQKIRQDLRAAEEALRREMDLHLGIRRILHAFTMADYTRLLTLLHAAARGPLSTYTRDEASKILWRLCLRQPRLLLLGLRALLTGGSFPTGSGTTRRKQM